MPQLKRRRPRLRLGRESVINATKRNETKIKESKIAFFCLRLFFQIETFQWVMTDISKKTRPRPFPVFAACCSALSPSSLPALRFAPPLEPATGKDIARIWFSEKKMSTLAMLAPGRLFAAARRGPEACQDRSRQQGAGGRPKPVHQYPEFDRMADDLSAAPGREISRSSRRRGRTTESHSVLHSTFEYPRPLTSGP